MSKNTTVSGEAQEKEKVIVSQTKPINLSSEQSNIITLFEKFPEWIKIEVSDSASSAIAKISTGVKYGAREVNRKIDKLVTDPIQQHPATRLNINKAKQEVQLKTLLFKVNTELSKRQIVNEKDYDKIANSIYVEFDDQEETLEKE
jgi:hypothetical protein